MKQTNALYNGRPTIALLAGSLTSKYHEEILRGVEEAAKKLNMNVIVFAGGPINSPDPLALNRSSLFDLVDLDLFDGIIIPFSSHSRYLDEEGKQNFLNRFKSLHIVNVGSKIDGLTNIVSDTSSGINDTINHLVNTHNYKKIAFVRGPINHKTSDLRTEIYKNALIKNNIKVNEDLIFYSDLNKIMVKNIANQFINEDGSFICDAIITYNDNQALGLLEAFKDLNIKVPEDIAICGSINDTQGLFSSPPLTTIYEPNFELGFTAAETIHSLITGTPLPNKKIIKTSLIIRNSCGCESINIIKNKSSNIDTKKHVLVDHKEVINKVIIDIHNNFNIILKKYKSFIDTKTLDLLLVKFKESLLKEDFIDFINLLHVILNNNIESEEIITWLAIISAFQSSTQGYLRENISEDKISNLITNLINLQNDIEFKAIKFQSFTTDNYINYFKNIANNLNSSFDLNSVYKYILYILNIREFHLSAYNYIDNNIDSVTNFMTIRDNKNILVPPENKTFSKVKLLPSSISKFEKRYTLLVLPLSFRKKPLGYILLGLSNRKVSAYENMQAIISTALKNELQILALKKAEERFSDIAHSTSNWLWESDKDFKFTYSSNSVKDVLGYTPDEIIGRKILSFSLPSNYAYYERIIAKEKMQNVECWYRHKNNMVVCLLISANPIFKDDVFIGYRGVFEDITEQKFQEEKITHLAYSDVLTDLPNRAMFQEQLELTIKTAKKVNSTFALIFLDLDRFKYINDSFGHGVGDILLKRVSEILIKCTRSKDTVARLGGDEFTIIIPEVSAENEVIYIVQRIISSLTKPIDLQGKQVHISASLGISLFPLDGDNSTTLLKNSDNAMYQAKSLGRNRYVFYDKVLEKKNSKRIMHEDILHTAITNNQFILYYQPQVDTYSGKMLGVEALVRINNPQKGIISPGNFIPLAESLGLIGTIDETVLILACKQHNQWIEEGLGQIRISLNLSAIQLKNRNVIEQYIAIIKNYKVNPKYIQFEITEHTLIDNEEIALEILHGFKSKGFSIALDDFGTGYSSLSCINLYPIDTIKIDRSFVVDAVSNLKNRAIIDAIMHLAKSLSLKIVAEGVETKEQYELIKSFDCDEIQGFYFYKPCNGLKISKILKED